MVVCCHKALRCGEHPFSTWLDVVEAMRSMNILSVRGWMLSEALRSMNILSVRGCMFITRHCVVMNILSVRGCMLYKALRCDEHPFSTWLYVHKGIAL